MHKKHLTKYNTFMIKTFSKVGIEGNYLNMIKTICENPQQTPYSMMKD